MTGRRQHPSWIIWCLTVTLRFYNFCKMSMKCWSGTCSLLIRHDCFIWPSVQGSTVVVTRTTKDPKPNFGCPCLPPLSQRDKKILRVPEKQNQELSKSPGTQQNYVQFQHQFHQRAVVYVFQFRPQASSVVNKKPGTENSPANVDTWNNQDFKRNFLDDIFWHPLDETKDHSQNIRGMRDVPENRHFFFFF